MVAWLLLFIEKWNQDELDGSQFKQLLYNQIILLLYVLKVMTYRTTYLLIY